MFFRLLPEPTIPASVLKALLSLKGIPDVGSSASAMKIFNEHDPSGPNFPPNHLPVLRLLLALLHRLTLCADLNKMTAKNLAVCLAPSLLRSEGSDGLSLEDLQPGIHTLTRLISFAPDIFPHDLWDDYPSEG
jgi:hypothetical protein